MMNYDLHHIVKTLHSASENVKIDVSPIDDEKFVALNYGVYIERRKRKRDEVLYTSTCVSLIVSSLCPVA